MAVRKPLYWDGSALKEMNVVQTRDLHDRAIYLYAQDPSVTLRSLIANNGNLNAITDTRYQAGDVYTRTDRFGTAAETPDIEEVQVTWDYLDQVNEAGLSLPVDQANRRFPVYLDDDGNIRSMDLTDFIDTFIGPALSYMTTNLTGSNDRRGGTYMIAGDGLIDKNNPPDYLETVSIYPVFLDTIADISAYQANRIPEAKDQPTNATEYYLYKYKGFASPTVPSARPLYVNSDGDLREFSNNQLDQVLDAIKTVAVDQNSGYKLQYQMQYSTPTNGSIRGTLVNTILNGASEDGYNQRLLSADSYYTQEFPNGVPTAANTYYFTVELV